MDLFSNAPSSHNLLIDPAFPGEKVSKAGPPPPPHSPHQQNSDATGRDLDIVATSQLPLPSPTQYIQAIMTKNHNQRR